MRLTKIPEGFHLDASPLTPVKLKFDCEWSVVLDNELPFWFPFESMSSLICGNLNCIFSDLVDLIFMEHRFS